MPVRLEEALEQVLDVMGHHAVDMQKLTRTAAGECAHEQFARDRGEEQGAVGLYWRAFTSAPSLSA